jgi:hypothetical protein
MRRRRARCHTQAAPRMSLTTRETNALVDEQLRAGGATDAGALSIAPAASEVADCLREAALVGCLFRLLDRTYSATRSAEKARTIFSEALLIILEELPEPPPSSSSSSVAGAVGARGEKAHADGDAAVEGTTATSAQPAKAAEVACAER